MPVAHATVVARTHARLEPARERLRALDACIVRTQLALSRIPAPTGDESQRGDELLSRFLALQLCDVRRDAAGNVLGLRAGTIPGAPPVVVCAHMDTVFPRETPLTFRHEGTRLVGPGIGDNGRGLAVMLALAAELAPERWRTEHPLLFAGTTGEEGAGDLRGAKALFAGAAAGAHAAIALDGAGDERVVHSALGARRFRITFTGPGGHSWAAFGVPNPVHAVAAAAARLGAITMPAAPRTTLSVTRIGGGLSVNAIPDQAWMEVDLRSTSARLLARFATEVAAVVVAAAEAEDARRAAHTTPLRIAIEIIGDRPCGDVPSTHRLVRAAFEATRLVGRAPASATASTDANVPIGLGIPAVAIGAGGHGGAAHTLSEWYDNRNGPVGVARALTLLAATAGLAE